MSQGRAIDHGFNPKFIDALGEDSSFSEYRRSQGEFGFVCILPIRSRKEVNIDVNPRSINFSKKKKKNCRTWLILLWDVDDMLPERSLHSYIA
jgi:hypothetical protein